MSADSTDDRLPGENHPGPRQRRKFRFTENELKIFAAASHDSNPLHLDEDYARRTPYGRPVVFGALAVLRCLDSLGKGHSRQVGQIEAEFSHPLFTDVEYQLWVDELRPDNAIAEVREGELVLARVRVAFRAVARREVPGQTVDEVAAGWSLARSSLRDVPKDHGDNDLIAAPVVSGHYAVNSARRRLARGAARSAASLQSSVLMLCSYLVGMELPGQRSLLYKLRLDFDQACGSVESPLRYELRTRHFESAYGLLEMDLAVHAAGGTVATGAISAFVRKKLAAAQPSTIRKYLKAAGGSLSGKVALVTGGSRGLGAAIVQALALQGAHVVLNFLRSREAAEALQAQLRDAPGTVTLHQGDARSPAWCAETKKWLLGSYGGIDLLVCNACEPPLALGDSESGLLRRQRYAEDNLALAAQPMRAFSSAIEMRRGAVVAISSSIVESNSQHWPEYTQMKRDVEAELQKICNQHAAASYLIVRPPALLTDMSNTPSRWVAALAPEVVAAATVNALAAGIEPGKVEMLTDFPAAQAQAPTAEEQTPADREQAKLVISATFTAKPLLPVIEFWTKSLGWSVDSELAPYNQVYQQLLNPQSALSSNQSGLNVILIRFGDWLRELPETNLATAQPMLAWGLSELIDALTAYARRPHCRSLLVICPESAAHRQDKAWERLIRPLEQRLVDAVSGLSGLDVVRSEDYHARYELSSDIYDPLSDEIGHIPYTAAYYGLLGTLVARRFCALAIKPYKVIVVDCDNTLWRGVCGEVGARGVQLDDAAHALQRFLLQQKQQGMLLCLCSKNSEEDVHRVFETRTDMPLKRSDFVDERINWQPKSENLISLAAGLNLGLDSVVFMDDNVVECAEVAAACPQVLTLQIPAGLSELQRLLDHTWVFDHFTQTEEDAKRTELYQADRQRREVEKQSDDFRAFLASLNLEIEIQPAAGGDLARVAQLSQRTNQFNFTTIRRTEGEFEALIAQGAVECQTVRVRDRFGEYGLVGLIVFARDGDALAVESFMLSCRVLGRGVEHRVMANLGRRALDCSAARVRVRFEETSANRPARLFLEDVIAATGGRAESPTQWSFAAEALAQLQYEPPQDVISSATNAKLAAASREGGQVEPASQRPAMPWSQIAIELSDLRELAQRVRSEVSEKRNAELGKPFTATEQHRPREDRHARLLRELKALFGQTLDLDLTDVDAEADLETYVRNSIDNVSLTVELKKRFPDIPLTILFEHRSLQSIATYLIGEHAGDLPGGDTAETGDAAEATDDQIAHLMQPMATTAGSTTARPSVRQTSKAGDIAIIGINGRFPMAPTVSDLWDNLRAGKSSITEVPPDRWPVDAFFDAEQKADKSYCKRGGFLEAVDHFDAGFFRISPREAELMDPQQRLFLEVVWGLLEDGGYTRETIGRETGVFVGCNASDYGLYANTMALDGVSAYRDADFYQISNRISYFFDFHGPSICLDTACSSSGTAIYLACQSLRNGQCQVAIAGGVNLFLHPSRFIQYSQMHMLSPTGQCSPFGEKANGTVFGEGVGALLLKPLADAERDADHIHAVIKGCAINAGGKTNGFTVPNPAAQAELVSRALRDAEVDPGTITYVEAHGTGTPLGDPIEVRGLTMAFEQNYGPNRPDAQHCAIGSVKANIGHLEAGAAIAGMLKIIGQMNQGNLVPSLHSRSLNPSIPFASTPFRVQQEVVHWERPTRRENGHVITLPRRAAISSFGAGGSNAHIILEEYVPTEGFEAKAPQTELILLSARKQDDLTRYASTLCAFLTNSSTRSEADGGPCLADIAFTLQVGREHMEERLALVVASVEELVSGLDSWIEIGAGEAADQGSLPGNMFRGRVRPKQGEAQEHASAEGEASASKLFNERRFSELAALWVNGDGVDWQTLTSAKAVQSGNAVCGRRIPLPTYSFAEQTFWLPGAPNLKLAQADDERAGGGHPMLGGIDPELSAGQGIVFYSSLAAHKPIVRDHVVGGQSLLPGVGYLEMTCAALKRVGMEAPFRFESVVWSQPLVIEDGPSKVLVSIKAAEAGEFAYEIRSGAAMKSIANATGSVRRLESAPDQSLQRIAIAQIGERCPESLDKETIYQRFRSMGIDYGPYFQSLEQIVRNRAEALGQIRIPGAFEGELGEFTLHPSLLDGALQTALIMFSDSATALPFSVTEIEILRSPGALAYAHVTQIESERFDVTVCDQEGSVCVRLKDLCLRPLKDSGEQFFFTPRWKPSPFSHGAIGNPVEDAQHVLIVYSEASRVLAEVLAGQHAAANVYNVLLGEQERQLDDRTWEVEASEPASLPSCLGSLEHIGRIYFLGGITSGPLDVGDLDAVDLSQEAGVLSLFRMLKSLNERGLTQQRLDLFVITNDVFRLQRQARTRPCSASLLGLGRVIAKEFPRLQVRCLDISLDGWPDNASDANWPSLLRPILEEPPQAGGEVVIRNGRRFVRVLEMTRLSAADELPYRKRGVYLILGGAGGLGFEFSRYLADKVQARLVWVGRSPLDSAKREKILEVQSRGGEVLYLQAEATDPVSMQAALRQAKDRFGPIQGAAHSAIVLSDRTLANMSEPEFNAALAPKVRGSAVLYRTLKDEPLDFLLFFSSANSFMAAMGQSNYVAGCCFKDAIGRHLNEVAGFPGKVINWGYWGTTGIVSGDDYRQRMTAQGHRSIEPREGVEAIGRVLSAPVEQVMAIKASDEALADMGVDLTARVELYSEPTPCLVEEVVAGEDPPAISSKSVTRFTKAFEQLEQLGREWLVASLRRMGILLAPGEIHDPVKLRSELGIVEAHFRSFDALLDLLIDAGVLEKVREGVITTEKLSEPGFSTDSSQFEVRKDGLASEFPEIADRIPLLSACLTSMPEILTGNKGHMEVMFPGGSLALVEQIYSGNEITQHFNRRLARLVADYVRRRVELDSNASIRILEVGAGTGASSVHVLEALRECGLGVQYLYTDISKQFLQHGERAYRQRYPFVEFKQFDLEKDPEPQGLERCSFDLVVGTNCIHATRNITATLHRIKRLLRMNGVLMLNEFTKRLDYNTLTFGLTTGWWLFEDDALRIKNTPLLDCDGWRQLLTGNGICDIHFLDLAGLEEPDVGQCLIIGESDGRVLLERSAKQQKAPNATGAVSSGDHPSEESAVAAVVVASGQGQHESADIKSPTGNGPASDDQLRERAVDQIKNVLAEVIKMQVSDIDEESTFDSYGVDSLIALTVNQRLEKDFGRLRGTLLFEYPTVTALADYFVDAHREALAQRFEASGAQTQPDSTGAAVSVTSSNVVAEPVRPSDALPQPLAERSLGAEREDSRVRPGPAQGLPSGDEEASGHPALTGHDEPIAVVGIAGRYPMADTLDAFWENLKAGRDCVTEIPRSRWDAQAHYGADADGSSRSHSKWGGFVNDVDKFDALFFNISPKEAVRMDPQERLFLETVWHAVEDAGYTRRSLDVLQKRAGRGIGVFVGSMYQQYPFLSPNLETGAVLASSSYWAIANRVSFFFGLTGPSLAVDTACSSSLTAIHLACESLKRGECVMAVAGGVNLNLHPSKYLRLQQLGMLGSTAQSRSLGDGDGLVPGEGVGAVLLKPLGLAIRDKDPVYGVIKRSAVNHGGKAGGFTVPNPNAQTNLITETLDAAGVDPRSINYVEVAANGAALGDALEIVGLTNAFQRSTSDHQFCALGSVKSNLGHLEAASGVAQLSKVLLQMKHGLLVPSLNAEPLNPDLQLETSPFYVQQQLSRWHRTPIAGARHVSESPFRAAISSFGAGGANAHLIVEEYQVPASDGVAPADGTAQLIVLSARTETSLKAYAESLFQYLRQTPESASRLINDDGALRRRVREELVSLIADLLRVRPGDIATDVDLAELGCEPTHYVALSGALRDRFGIEARTGSLLENRTVEATSEYLHSHYLQALQTAYDESAETLPPIRATESLHDIAYTLQVGREPMRERLAVVVSSKEELADKLEKYCQGVSNIESVHRGRVSSKTAAAMLDDVEGKAYLKAVVNNRKLDKLAQLWTAGIDVDWEQLHEDGSGSGVPRRVSLPTYPFDKHRYWIETAAPLPSIEQPETVTTSDQDSAPRSEFSNDEDLSEPVAIEQHVDNGQAVADSDVLHSIKCDVGQLVASLLGVDGAEIDFDEELRAYGCSSVDLAVLAKRVMEKFDVDVPASVFLGYSTVAACAEGLWGTHKEQLRQYYAKKGVATSVRTRSVEPLPRPTDKATPIIKGSAQAPELASGAFIPVAIVGIGGRLPGSNSMEQFWENLNAGRELIGEIPQDRWDWQKYYGDPNSAGNKTWVKWGAFLQDVDKFDSLFFGISPREAQMMDPRQRLMLEAVWSAIENAGYSPAAFAGSNTGLFVGVGNNDYSEVLRAANVELSGHASTGLMVNSILSSRISYLLDLHGPSELVDTACSSSTVALHRAVRAIQSGECDSAIAGGVNVLLDPQGFVILNKAGVLSTEGKVRLFSDGATGYVRGEGVGAVLLKSLRQAVADRDHIYAVVRASAVNQDGKSYSLTAPNPRAQANVVLKAYREAAIDPGSISYIEAQGTGSPLADPVEIEAFKMAFNTLYEERGMVNGVDTCRIGYLKPNIGHLECASGIAALLKILWALKTNELPATCNVDERAATKYLKDSPFRLCTSNQRWESKPHRDGSLAPRRAGLHSFGFGGVNAHVVLEDYSSDGARAA
ncbi:MAG: SDR family NAD(P)-dependent oxidoreductase [Betaproteobacteria bacterium]|nr:MAG: SDR family NAD(P)-dependent oxidoreductase [Betaproteobacteria bacterium]